MELTADILFQDKSMTSPPLCRLRTKLLSGAAEADKKVLVEQQEKEFDQERDQETAVTPTTSLASILSVPEVMVIDMCRYV